MTAVVAVETVLLVVLLVLVVGLLRSHAEILRRLGPELPEANPVPQPPTAARPTGGSVAVPIAGATPSGDAVVLDPATLGPTLLAFLTTGCGTCARFWETLGDRRVAAGVQTVIVTHDRDRESPSRLKRMAPANTAVVMSSRSWSDYEVPGSPYFVLIDGDVRGEGVATTWDALASLITDAIEDQRADAGGAARARHVDDVLAAAGIGPDDPSLYPGPPAPRRRSAT